jgi:hypothetical protein
LERLVRIPAGSELGVAMTVHERWLDKSSSRAVSIIWLRGICSLYGIGRFRLADLKCVYVLM